MAYVFLTRQNLLEFKNDLSLDEYVSFDIETRGLNWFEQDIRLAQYEVNDNIYILDIEQTIDGISFFKEITKLIKDKTVISHNAVFEIVWTYHKTGIFLKKIYDTQIAEKLLTAGLKFKDVSLKGVAKSYCDYEMSKDERMNFVTEEEITNGMYEYAALDVAFLKKIREIQLNTADKWDKMRQVFLLEMKLVPVVSRMIYEGVGFDFSLWLSLTPTDEEFEEVRKKVVKFILDKTFSENTFVNALDAINFHKIKDVQIGKDTKPQKVSAKFRQEILKDTTNPTLIKQIVETHFNVKSPLQLQNVMPLLGLSKAKKKGSLTTDQKVLKRFPNNEFAKILIEKSKMAKHMSTYGKNWESEISPTTGRVHPGWNQTVDTGRMSCRAPNMQNTPPKKRHCFVARDGYCLITVDYSQAELRLAAAVAKDIRMTEAFIAGEDLHSVSASAATGVPYEEIYQKGKIDEEEPWYGYRNKIGKTVNFLISYGGTAHAYRQNVQGVTEEEADRVISGFFTMYPGIKQYLEKIQKAVQQNYFVQTPFGRYRFWEKKTALPRKEYYGMLGSMQREAVNHPIQGGSADILKMAMVDMFFQNPFGWDNFIIIIQQHDELIVEVKKEYYAEASKYIVERMEYWEQKFLGVIPAKADVADEMKTFWKK